MMRTALALLGLTLSSSVAIGCHEGVVAKDFKLVPLEDQARTVSLQDFKGKTVLLDFWATWCGPCNDAMPEVQEAWQKYRARGLEVVSISQEDRETILAFHRSKPYTYPVYIDPKGEANVSYGVTNIPRFILIQDGQVIWDVSGFSKGELSQRISDALG